MKGVLLIAPIAELRRYVSREWWATIAAKQAICEQYLRRRGVVPD